MCGALVLALSAAVALGGAAAVEGGPSAWPGDPTGLVTPPRVQPLPPRAHEPLQRLRELALSQVRVRVLCSLSKRLRV